ncbi:hypothetical protein F25303_7462 [Fusarium sp. NRRL 25303]|nr:hypothetical protein F25303_7462 [Fusarium sp. NRRL 25303]
MDTTPDASTVMNSRVQAHNFQKEPAKVNFHDMFHGLARAYNEGEFDDECQGPILSGTLEKADVPDPVAKEGETSNAVVEAAQLAENLSLAVQAQWQFACSIYIGDIRQLPPIAVTVDQQDFKAIVSLQRKTILFHRMESARQIHFRLRRNYRAYVHSHELAQNMFYRDLRGQENSEPYCGVSK